MASRLLKGLDRMGCGVAVRTHGDRHRDGPVQFGRGLDVETADRFVAMYVNDLTLDMGEEGRRAVDELLARVG